MDSKDIKEFLEKNIPKWKFENNYITRVYSTGNWNTSMAVANAIGLVAEIAWHHPDIIIAYPRITVKLQTHDAGGVTKKDLELAKRIEEVVCWKPEQSGGLEENPNLKIT